MKKLLILLTLCSLLFTASVYADDAEMIALSGTTWATTNESLQDVVIDLYGIKLTSGGPPIEGTMTVNGTPQSVSWTVHLQKLVVYDTNETIVFTGFIDVSRNIITGRLVDGMQSQITLVRIEKEVSR
jgi:hypothetical protein